MSHTFLANWNTTALILIEKYIQEYLWEKCKAIYYKEEEKHEILKEKSNNKLL